MINHQIVVVYLIIYWGNEDLILKLITYLNVVFFVTVTTLISPLNTEIELFKVK